MLSVCIETATSQFSVALGDEHGVVASFVEEQGRRHVESLIPALDALLRSIDAPKSAITHIAVDIGPGMFSGLRVGVAAAKALALALDLPLIACRSLDILAWAYTMSTPSPERELVAVIDARRGELYAAHFRLVDDTPFQTITAMSGPTVGTIAEINAAYDTANSVVVGDPDTLLNARTRSIVTAPTADTIAAVLASGAGWPTVEADGVDVLYLRDADADLPTVALKQAP